MNSQSTLSGSSFRSSRTPATTTGRFGLSGCRPERRGEPGRCWPQTRSGRPTGSTSRTRPGLPGPVGCGRQEDTFSGRSQRGDPEPSLAARRTGRPVLGSRDRSVAILVLMGRELGWNGLTQADPRRGRRVLPAGDRQMDARWPALRFCRRLRRVQRPGAACRGNTRADYRVYVASGKEQEVCSLGSLEVAGTLGSWLSIAPNADPIILRDLKSEDIYELLLEH